MGTYLIAFTIRAVSVCFVSTLFFVSCASSSSQQTVILTKGMLKNYKISVKELSQYQFYLGESLELQGDTTDYKNNRDLKDPHSVNLANNNESRTVIFPAGTPGKLLSADTKVCFTGSYVSIIINFGIAYGGDNYNLVLRFSPDLSGKYTLDHGWIFNNIRLKRKGLKYNCMRGCWGNYLWVSGKENKNPYSTRWQASGNSFSSGGGGRP